MTPDEALDTLPGNDLLAFLPVGVGQTGPREDIMPKGDPDYWKKTHEPLNLELQSVVAGSWADQPPIADLQLQFIPHYAGKHCLESVRISRLANEGGAHAVAVGLLRDAVEALSLVALGISHDPDKVRLLSQWNEERLSAGDLRKHLEAKVWPQVFITGLWGESWDSFWASLARSVQPYAHFSPLRMRWHQHVQIIDGKWHIWINHPSSAFEIYRAARLVAFQLLIFWAFAELVCAFDAAPRYQLSRLTSLAGGARQWLSTNYVFFQGEKWEVQLIPFVYPTGSQYWDQ